MFVIKKITWYQNIKKVKVMTSKVCFCNLDIARKNADAHYISALSCHTASCRHIKRWKQDQEYKTKTKAKTKAASPVPRPRPVWDRPCYMTAVSDPKTGTEDKNSLCINLSSFSYLYFTTNFGVCAAHAARIHSWHARWVILFAIRAISPGDNTRMITSQLER